MELAENFVCGICLDTIFKGSLKRCTGCKKAFHSPCILPWLRLHQEHPSCPACRASPMELFDDRYLEEIFAALQKDLLVTCQFCLISVRTRELLGDHYALCSAYQRKLSKKAYERAEFIFELLSRNTPQIFFDFKYPSDDRPFLRAELDLPDRRENAQALVVVLFVRKNSKKPTEYAFDVGLAAQQPCIPRFPIHLGAILSFCKEEVYCEVRVLKEARQVRLFKVTSSRPEFRVWAYIF
jgi:hypothetical protein